LVVQLDDLGHDVIVNGVGGAELVPPLEPLPSRVGGLRNSLPLMLTWLARMLWRWRRTTRTQLREAGIDHILVWDPVLAGLCRMARPSGVEVVWVPSHTAPARFYEAILRALLSITADRVVVSWLDDARWVRGGVTISALPRPTSIGEPRLDAWVVLASAVPPPEDALERLARDGSDEPAAAVVFDARAEDRVSPELTERLRAASGAANVWWAAGDEWLNWLGGVPQRAVDPNRALVVDHRHVRVLAEGGSLRAAGDAMSAKSAPLLTPVKDTDGWTEFALRDDVPQPTDETGWAASAFSGSAHPVVDRVAAAGVAISVCPICGASDRRLAGTTDGATAVWQCRACGLRHASHVLSSAPALAHDNASGDGFDRALAALAEAGVAKGRLLHVITRTDARPWAATDGWDITSMTAAALADGAGELFDVAVFDGSLESVREPVGLLRDVRERWLHHGGHIVVRAPNARSVSRYVQRTRWSQWRPGERVSYPDLWTMRQLLQRSGFQTRLLRTDSDPERPATGAALAREIGLVSAHAARVWPPIAGVLNRAPLDGPLRTATAWIDRRGFGLNVIAVGRSI
jgi:hypothetical protein